eukprot:1096526-Prymnesium_polylepis.1
MQARPEAGLHSAIHFEARRSCPSETAGRFALNRPVERLLQGLGKLVRVLRLRINAKENEGIVGDCARTAATIILACDLVCSTTAWRRHELERGDDNVIAFATRIDLLAAKHATPLQNIDRGLQL